MVGEDKYPAGEIEIAYHVHGRRYELLGELEEIEKELYDLIIEKLNDNLGDTWEYSNK